MRKQFSKSEIKDLLTKLPAAEVFLSKKSVVVQEDDVLLVDNVVSFFYVGDFWVPSLHALLKYTGLLPKVVVDKGAIKFVVNGADIMRPGVVRCDDFENNSFVVIVDETYGKPLAVGRTLFSSDDLINQTSGKVISSLHFVGDEYWKR